ncbi:MAG TPA: hypothetical protein EYN54_11720 [Methylococcaceae bacterium]|nr:hypothetical protein [Methylococcaceae bacterium]
MKQLTDIEICKRIAEIEGECIASIDRKVYDWNNKHYPVEISLGHVKKATLLNWYNPLTDKALCFDLMVKYKVYIDYFGGKGRAALQADTESGEFEVDIVDISMNKAICLAIIEAHKE